MASYESYVRLAERLNALAPGDFPKKTLFLNSGAEAVENAIKIGPSGNLAIDKTRIHPMLYYTLGYLYDKIDEHDRARAKGTLPDSGGFHHGAQDPAEAVRATKCVRK